jgi:hypothetical protein
LRFKRVSQGIFPEPAICFCKVSLGILPKLGIGLRRRHGFLGLLRCAGFSLFAKGVEWLSFFCGLLYESKAGIQHPCRCNAYYLKLIAAENFF